MHTAFAICRTANGTVWLAERVIDNPLLQDTYPTTTGLQLPDATITRRRSQALSQTSGVRSR